MAGRPENSWPQLPASSWLRLMAPGMSRWSAAKSSAVRTSISVGAFAVPISRDSFSADIVVGEDMDAPSFRVRDAILGHVASWGDRKTPKAVLQPKSADAVNAVRLSCIGFAYTKKGPPNWGGP